MTSNLAFPYPFTRNGCVPVAWTHLAQADAPETFARSLAGIAQKRGGQYLTPAGIAYDARNTSRLHWWAGQCGLRVAQVVRYLKGDGATSAGSEYKLVRRHPTLARWARLHRRGRYIVFVSCHAVAVIDGVIFGYYRPRSLVQVAAKVEVAA